MSLYPARDSPLSRRYEPYWSASYQDDIECNHPYCKMYHNVVD